MIAGYSVDEFAALLGQHLSPTSPVNTAAHLFGRQKQLRQIDQALYVAGRTIFIYGDRGVGKTSLAHTVANTHQNLANKPIILACTPQTTFVGLMDTLLTQLGAQEDGTSKTRVAFKVNLHVLGGEASRESQSKLLHESKDILNAVVSRLLEVSKERQNQVIVIDEFDRIAASEERTNFADFIKQVGDQRIPIRFIFCGVAGSLHELFGAHASCFRYLEHIKLETLYAGARLEIVDGVARAMGVTIDDRPRHRIAAISDGFPFYIHRMCEQLFWQMFRDPLPRRVPSTENYREAVVESVRSIEEHLKVTYDRAVMQGTASYDEILWAVADHSDLDRSTETIYQSYEDIMSHVNNASVILDRTEVVRRLNTLKRPERGSILSSPRKSWYRFNEGIMRGYVRLRAEECGYELALDYDAPRRSHSGLGWMPRPARGGRFGTSPSDRRKTEMPEG